MWRSRLVGLARQRWQPRRQLSFGHSLQVDVPEPSPGPYVSRARCPRTGAWVLTFDHADGYQPWGTPLAEHRFFPLQMAELERRLDECVREMQAELPQKRSCIVLRNTGKYWSNGYDLQWMAAHEDQARLCLSQSERLLGQMLTCPVPIVAALGGHATALGMMMALACDYRVMGARGLFSTPAVELGLSISPGLVGLVKCKLPPHLQRDLLVHGRKLRSEELLKDGVVSVRSDTRDEEELMAKCMDFVEAEVLPSAALAKPDTYASVKKSLYADAYGHLSESIGTDVEQYVELSKSMFTPVFH